MAEQMMSAADAAAIERVTAFADTWRAKMAATNSRSGYLTTTGPADNPGNLVALDESDLRTVLDRLGRLKQELETLHQHGVRPALDGVCGTTFGRGDVPIFICTLEPHDGNVHASSGGIAQESAPGHWLVHRGASTPSGRIRDFVREAQEANRPATSGPLGIMRVPLETRNAAIRDHYMAFAFSGRTAVDRERDQVIGHLLSELSSRDDELARLKDQLANHQLGSVLRGWLRENGTLVFGEAGWCREKVRTEGGRHVVANTCSYVHPWRDAEENDRG